MATLYRERYIELRPIESSGWTADATRLATVYTNIGSAYIELRQDQKPIDQFDRVSEVNQTYSAALVGKEKATENLER